MARKLYLIYGMDDGKSEKTISISDPAPGLSKSAIDAAASIVLSSKALDTEGSSAVEYKGAEYRETVVEKVA